MRRELPFRIVTAAGGVALLAAVACLLGWVKTVYYFHAFGLRLSPRELSLADHAGESWFVLQNVLLFLGLWWIVIRTRQLWAAAVGLLHAAIPIGAHYAFAVVDWAPAAWLIHYRHALLKLLPFAVLAGVWLFQPRLRPRLRSFAWDHGGGPLALLAVVTFCWSLSAAKHFGSYDAQLALLAPDDHLLRVRIPDGASRVAGPAAGGERLYLLHSDENRLVLWDGAGFVYGSSAALRIVIVSREALPWFEGRRALQLQPGSQFL
jgi:hypothetical protein